MDMIKVLNAMRKDLGLPPVKSPLKEAVTKSMARLKALKK